MTKSMFAGALAAVALALAGCGSSDEASPEPPTTTTPTTTTPTTQPPTDTEPAPQPPQVTTITIVVRNGRPVGGIQRPKVTKGDRVALVVRADTSGEVHLHGYDLEQPVAPGSPARIRFRATIPGRFDIELHTHPEIHIGELTVTP